MIKITGRPVDGETPREIRSDYDEETEARARTCGCS